MRLLLIAPQDSLESDSPENDSPEAEAPWLAQGWEQAVDLGRAPSTTYARWAAQLGCPVTGLLAFSCGIADLQTLRRQLDPLRGIAVDSYGLDWLEVLAVPRYGSWLQLAHLERMAQHFDAAREVALTSPCAWSAPLQLLFGARLRTVAQPRQGVRAKMVRAAGSARQLTLSQVADVLADKYDGNYRVRRRLARRPTVSQSPVVLVPTAYINVTRSAAAYAAVLPKQQFLLVATRPGAARFAPPANVRSANFASYLCSGDAAPADSSALQKKLRALREAAAQLPEWQFAERSGWFAGWEPDLQRGLLSRNGWLRVLEREPVAAVLCGDDGNPYTRIPLILAAQRGLPTVSYHHGALDGTAALKVPYARTRLAQGHMDLDYLQRVCGYPAEAMALGAATEAEGAGSSAGAGNAAAAREAIVFFSEAYEAVPARPSEVYRDLLPRLLVLARQHGKRLVIKLHPFESERGRRRLLRSLAIPDHEVDFISGPMTPPLLARAWFGITVESSAAIDCALAGVPCFLCQWAFTFDWGYPQQFARFGGGVLLESAEDVLQIPEILQGNASSCAPAAQTAPGLALRPPAINLAQKIKLELAQKIKPEEFMKLLGLNF